MTIKELINSRTAGKYYEGEPRYHTTYKVYDTLFMNKLISAELILKTDNTKDRSYSFLIRTYNQKNRQLVHNEVFASWEESLSGEFDTSNDTFKVYDSEGYFEYKIDTITGKVVEIE